MHHVGRVISSTPACSLPSLVGCRHPRDRCPGISCVSPFFARIRKTARSLLLRLPKLVIPSPRPRFSPHPFPVYLHIPYCSPQPQKAKSRTISARLQEMANRLGGDFDFVTRGDGLERMYFVCLSNRLVGLTTTMTVSGHRSRGGLQPTPRGRVNTEERWTVLPGA